ncbi:uncharacterized protein LOC100374985 [Saccoglossus kowalevskii]|uniref:tRNA-intron lyase n=1 Tax=Saccoglossus kowalevskii TaxID=10224 RepID=A0ABM0GT32_SACKO|nr:PREDICTED: tRNA-splicing endonuclease subunit Sen2-like [Saccoglossus kowalevskii]
MAALNKLTKPRRKKRIHQPESSPFPVPIESIDGKPASDDHWYYYTGNLVDNCVLVTNPGDIAFIYKMGFFGKGMFSRSKPEHKRFISSYQGTVRKNLPPNERRFQQQRFQQVRKRRYMRHLEWYKEYKEHFPLDFRGENDTDPTQSTSFEPKYMCSDENDGPTAKKMKLFDISTGNDDDDGATQTDDVTVKTDAARTCSSVFNNDVTTGYDDDTAGYNNVTPRNDDVTARIDDVTVGNDDVTTMEDIVTTSDKTVNKLDDVPTESKNISFRDDKIEKSEFIEHDKIECAERELMEDKTSNHLHKHDDIPCNAKNKCSDNDDVILCTQCDDVTKDDYKMESSDERTECTQLCDVRNESARIDSTQMSMESSDIVESSDEADEEEMPQTTIPSTVKDDSHGNIKHKNRKSIKKDDPYQVFEYLQLSLEEAFFLSYGLGCLTVLDKDKNSLNLSDMWLRYCAINPRFISSYAVYHYIRSKGWVPKTGIKFGSDYIVYKQGPPFYHSTYSVLISMVDEDTLLSCEDEQRPLTWPVICGMSRVTEHAAKEIMFCHVIKPSDMTAEEMKSPRCLERLKVQETVMRRWVSAKERMDKGSYSVIS